MTRSCKDSGAVFLLVNVNEGWQGRAGGLGQLFLNLTDCQCPDLLPRSGRHSQEMSHSRHQGMSPGMSPAGAAALGSAAEGGAAVWGEPEPQPHPCLSFPTCKVGAGAALPEPSELG